MDASVRLRQRIARERGAQLPATTSRQMKLAARPDECRPRSHSRRTAANGGSSSTIHVFRAATISRGSCERDRCTDDLSAPMQGRSVPSVAEVAAAPAANSDRSAIRNAHEVMLPTEDATTSDVGGIAFKGSRAAPSAARHEHQSSRSRIDLACMNASASVKSLTLPRRCSFNAGRLRHRRPSVKHARVTILTAKYLSSTRR